MKSIKTKPSCSLTNVNIIPPVFMPLVLLLLSILSCKKFVDINPPVTSTNEEIVYSNDATAIAAVTSMYVKMSQDGITGGITAMSLYPSLSADELSIFDGTNDQTLRAYYNNSLTPNNSGDNTNFWSSIYINYIFRSNAAIEGISKSTSLSTQVKKQLLGEAKFMRAFSFFYLVNLFGDVPLVLTTDYKINSTIGRFPKEEIYKQIIIDLKDAQNLLSNEYLDGTLLQTSEERVSPNKWAATALLARVYLYNNNWIEAEAQATDVINNSTLYDTVSTNQVFLINSKESIWELQSTSNVITNTSDAMLFILPESGPSYSNFVYLSNTFVQSFESGDKRKQDWIDSVNVDGITYYYPKKYKDNSISSTVTERTIVLRLAEQYLIRSEARARQNKLAGALSDINVIRQRAGLIALNPNLQEDMLVANLNERKAEFFTEWGHRWLDLKRFKVADQVLRQVKGNNWQDTDELYPIPYTDILFNINLANNQNPGY
jgi:hypothetical protein